MTFFAFAAAFPFGELAAMIILMAVRAERIFQSCQRFSGRMTFFAGHFRVTALELKRGLAMIEFSPALAAPPRRIMAAFTALLEFPVMNITMTVETAAVFYPGKLQIIRIVFAQIISDRVMALVTFDFDVLAGQREIGVLMIEFRRRFPAVHIMAFQAIRRRLTSMFVRMATRTGFRQPEKRFVRIIRFRTRYILIDDIFFVVTLAAFQTFMLTDKHEFCLRMIEILDSAVPPDQFAVPPEVFHVAGGTVAKSLVGM